MSDTEKLSQTDFDNLVMKAEEDSAQGVRSFTQAASEKLIGQTLNERYHLLSVLGEGGMGTVFLAQHLALKKIRAIKILHQHLLTDTNSIMRFQNEATLVSKLEHANIIAVHDIGATPENQPYIVMDYIEGTSLSDLVREGGAVDIERALPIFVQIADALEHAHGKGVIHRDLKPSNIMLIRSESGREIVKVLDFGIAKILPQEGVETQKLTKTGDVFGSPLYMSPEQCLGTAIDARSDIYSLGCLMYETLTGTPPFVGNTAYETFLKHLNETPARLKGVSADPLMRETIEVILFAALAKEPAQRYQTMSTVKEHLKLVQQGAHRNPISRIKTWWYLRQLRRGPQKTVVPFAMFVAANAVAVILISITVLLVHVLTRPVAENYRDTALWENQKPSIPKITQVNPSKLVMMTSVIDSLNAEIGVEPQTCEDLGKSLTKAGRWDDAIKFYKQAKKLYEGGNPNRISIDIIDVLGKIGNCHYFAGRMVQAEECYKSQIQMLRKLTPSQTLAQREPWERLASIHATRREWSSFITDFQYLQEIYRTNTDQYQAFLSPLLRCQYADALYKSACDRSKSAGSGRDTVLKLSRDEYLNAVQRLDSSGFADPQIRYLALAGMAEVEMKQGDLSDAKRHFNAGVAQLEVSSVNKAVVLPVVYANFADLCYASGDYLSWLYWRTRAWIYSISHI